MYATRDDEQAVILVNVSELATLAGAVGLAMDIGEDLGFDVQANIGLLQAFKDAILVFEDDAIIDTLLEDHPQYDTPEIREKVRKNLARKRERANG